METKIRIFLKRSGNAKISLKIASNFSKLGIYFSKIYFLRSAFS